MADRLETLKTLVGQNPSDCRVRFMLAKELGNAGKVEDALREYEAILAADADYLAAYYHGGQTLAQLGRTAEAQAIYRRGIEACTRTGDAHTRSELEEALAAL